MGLLTTLFRRSSKRTTDMSAAAAFLLGGWPGVAEWPDDNYETFARQGYAGNELVYSCIAQITSSASEAELTLQRDTKDGTPERVETGALADLIARPNPLMSPFELMEALNLYLQIAGNAYVFKLRGGLGQVAALYLLRPDRVQIVPGDGVAQGYVYQVDGREYRLAPEDVGHIKLPNPLSDWYGLSPLHVLAREVNLDTGMTDFVKAFFGNAGIPAGLLKLKRQLNSQEEADYVRARWRNQFNGPQGWHKLAVIDMDAEYQSTAVRPDEMAMPDLRNLTESRICMAFGVPLSVVGATLGMASSSYANRVSDRKLFWEGTLLPLYRRIADALNRILLPEFPDASDARLAFDFGNVAALQDDLTVKSERVVKLWESGLLMRDEARGELGYDPSPTGHGAVFKSALSVVLLGPDAETAMPQTPEPEPEPSRTVVTDVDPDDEGEEDRPKLLPPDPAKIRALMSAKDSAGGHPGVIVALRPPRLIAELLVVPGGEAVEDLHLTLCYLGEMNVDVGPTELSATLSVVTRIAAACSSIGAEVSGWGRFVGGEAEAFYASVDAPALPAFRQRLVSNLVAAGVSCNTEHGFTPHITLAYLQPGDEDPEWDASAHAVALAFGTLEVWAGDQRLAFPFTGDLFDFLNRPPRAYITLTQPTQRQRALLDLLERVTTALTDRYEPEVAKHFKALRQRVDGVVGRHMAAPAPESKIDPLPFGPDDLVPAESEADLARLMRSMYLSVAEQTWDAINTSGLLGVEAFEPGTPAVQRILAEGANRAVQITDATRDALRLALQQGFERGYSIQQIANGVPADDFPGLKSLVTELYKNRARTIARTETATAQNMSAAARYEASGVAEVMVMDGDKDAACAAVNGTRQTTEWARSNPISHPNCTRAMLPVIPAFQRQRVRLPVEAAS